MHESQITIRGLRREEPCIASYFELSDHQARVPAPQRDAFESLSLVRWNDWSQWRVEGRGSGLSPEKYHLKILRYYILSCGLTIFVAFQAVSIVKRNNEMGFLSVRQAVVLYLKECACLWEGVADPMFFGGQSRSQFVGNPYACRYRLT